MFHWLAIKLLLLCWIHFETHFYSSHISTLSSAYEQNETHDALHLSKSMLLAEVAAQL